MQPAAVAVLPNGSRAYVLNKGATTGCNGEANLGQVLVINSGNNTVPSSGGCVSVGGTPTLIVEAGDGSRIYVPHLGPGVPPAVVARGVTSIDPTTNQVKADIGAPFTNPDCQSDSTPGTAQCPGLRMYPVFMVSQ
jgi:hypothetical protein